jgi:RNA polymerase sigma-70 factor (ECF subfamily)
LLKVRDSSNSQAWSEFTTIYVPLLYAYAVKAGLQDCDAADLAQDTLRQVVRYLGSFEYNESRGSFRGWLLTIARNLIRKSWRARANVATGGTDHLQLLSAQPSRSEKDQFELEYRRRLFELASERVVGEFQPATWQAFWKTAVENVPAASVAEQLELSVGAVYIARSRVLSRLRAEVARLDG